MSIRISDMEHLTTLTGVEFVPACLYVNGKWQWYRISPQDMATLMQPATKDSVGLSNVDNTSDADKPISTAVAEALVELAPKLHRHGIDAINGLAELLQGLADIDSNFTTQIESLFSILDQKSSTDHTHQQTDVNGLSETLLGKANTEHTHTEAEINGLEAKLNTFITREEFTQALQSLGQEDFVSQDELDAAIEQVDEKNLDTSMGVISGDNQW